LTAESYDPRYLEGIRWFNQREFFQAHEAWEGLWMKDRSPSREFYQGLIQVAVCLHHFRRGNTRGARKLYHTSRAYLNGYRPKYLGLDLDALSDAMQACCQALIASEEYFPTAKLDPDLIPRLQCDFPTAQDDAVPESLE
jgi:predicted metal-dependent hydrolase